MTLSVFFRLGFCVSFALSGVACSNRDLDYKSENIFSFMDSCVKQPGASARFCGCMMDHIRGKVDFKKFVEWDSEMVAKKSVPDDFSKVIAEARPGCQAH